MKKIKAFSLIETLVAMVIGAISIAAISYSYIYFNSSYQKIADKAQMSNAGRYSLQVISRDLRNAGYKNYHYNKEWDRWIEKTDSHNGTKGDRLRIWYNTSATDRIEIQYYLEKNNSGETYLVRDVYENPEFDKKRANCERYDQQTGCAPITIVENATDFQVFFNVQSHPLWCLVALALMFLTFYVSNSIAQCAACRRSAAAARRTHTAARCRTCTEVRRAGGSA